VIKKAITLLALAGATTFTSPPANAEPAKKRVDTSTAIKCLEGQQKLYVAFMHLNGSGGQIMCTSIDLQETETGLIMIRKKIEEIVRTRIVIMSILKLRA
jgi:hypothetical protein